MADLPILFSAPMVRAILCEIEQPGTGKTQTRRFLTADCDEPPAFVENGVITALDEYGRPYRWPRTKAVGDRLYVQEPWRVSQALDEVAPRDLDRTTIPEWLATDPNLYSGRKRPGMFLPRWASRLTLAVSEVRVQKLLDISEEDARSEGFADGPLGDPLPETDIGDGWSISSPGGWASAAGHFQVYWSQLHPDWDGFSSPWVAAYTFRPILGNIDQVRP